jgi:hypothetical protein
MHKNENEEMPLHLPCENNHDEIVLILLTIFNFLFTSFQKFILLNKNDVSMYSRWIIYTLSMSFLEIH